MKEKGIKAEMIRTHSLADLVRLASQVENSFIYSIKEKNKYRLMIPAEKSGKNIIIYYSESDSAGKYILYSRQEEETFEFKKELKEDIYQKSKIHIVELEGNPFTKPDTKDEISFIKIKDYKDLIKGLVYTGIKEEMPQEVYMFDSNGKTILCTFNQTDHSTQALIYSEFKGGKEFNFFRYNYVQDSVTEEKAVGRNTDFYVAVIKLAEPFRFFKL